MNTSYLMPATKQASVSLNLWETYKETIPNSMYLTHGIHAYTAKLIPHIPRYLIEKYTEKDQIVVDPFCGSGTTLLEARLLKRKAIGIDINPLACLIAEVKSSPLNLNDLRVACSVVLERAADVETKGQTVFPNIDYWFSKTAQNDLLKIKQAIESVRADFSNRIINFLLVCFSSIVRRSSYADPRMAKTYKSKRVHKRIQNGWVARPYQLFETAVKRNVEKVESLSLMMEGETESTAAINGDARNCDELLRAQGVYEVDMIITSPPYINAQDYVRSYKLELWWLGLITSEEYMRLRRTIIGSEYVSSSKRRSKPFSSNAVLNEIVRQIWYKNANTSHVVQNFFSNMEAVFRVLYKIVKKEGHCCLVTGNNTICQVPIQTHEILLRQAEKVGFQVLDLYRDEIRNRLLPPKRNHQGGMIDEEWVIVFKKGPETA